MKADVVKSILRALPTLVEIPARRFSVDYDRDADTLYISFERPQRATDTDMAEDGLLLRYRGEDLVGITVLEASSRVAEIQGAA